MSKTITKRPLPVGQIKNNVLRRALIVLCFPLLLAFCWIGNIAIGLFWLVKTLCGRSAALLKDGAKCWREPKEIKDKGEGMKLSAFDKGYEAAKKFRNNRISAIVNPFEPGFSEYDDFSEGVYKFRDEQRKSNKPNTVNG